MLVNNINILLIQKIYQSVLDIEGYKKFIIKALNLLISPGKDNARDIIIVLNKK